MFLDNDFARPLFDFDKGGAPKAFQCLCTPCNKVTRTERGMRMHLKSVHNWEEQPCLYSMDKPSADEKGKPRKLRLFTKENLEATTKRSLMTAMDPEAVVPQKQPQLKEQGKSDGPLLKLMNGEN